MKYSEIAKNFASELKFGSKTLPTPVSKLKMLVDKKNSIYTNCNKVFSEKHYSEVQSPIDLGVLSIGMPKEELYVLRMPIKFEGVWKIPEELWFLELFIRECNSYQNNFGITKSPFVYITIRHGEQRDQLTDVWHVDGFQGKPAERHIPEVSYIWTDKSSTEWAVQSFDIPKDFDPTKHNFFNVITPQVNESWDSPLNHVMLFNPYMVHRKKKYVGPRSMVRLTFSPVEIKDANYTPNPNFNLEYSKPEPRDELI